MARPIRRSLLIHTVLYQKVSESERFGKTYDPPIEIKRVRVEPKRSVLIGANQEQLISNSLLFVDATHSTKTEWKEGSKIEFNGVEYVIEKLNIFYGDSNKVHHWEAVMV